MNNTVQHQSGLFLSTSFCGFVFVLEFVFVCACVCDQIVPVCQERNNVKRKSWRGDWVRGTK